MKVETCGLCSRFTFHVSLFVSLFLFSSQVLFAGSEWKLTKGKHFVIHYKEDKKFSEQVLRQAEKHYKRITHDLGYTKHGNFWLWDNRANIYLYSTREKFVKAVGAPKWATGKADYEKRTIAGVETSQTFLESVLPHEMGHLVFRDFIGFKNKAPLWLDEGVAQWADKETNIRAERAAVRLYKKKQLMSLAALTAMDVRKVTDTGKAAEFYAQAASLVGFMIEKYGAERFTKFCRKLRDESSIDDALRFTYPEGLRSIDELERQWLKSFGGAK